MDGRERSALHAPMPKLSVFSKEQAESSNSVVSSLLLSDTFHDCQNSVSRKTIGARGPGPGLARQLCSEDSG